MTYNLLIVTFPFLYNYVEWIFLFWFLNNANVFLDAVQYWYERLLLCRYFFVLTLICDTLKIDVTLNVPFQLCCLEIIFL